MLSPRGEETLAERLEWLRHALGVQQQQVAAAIEASTSSYSNWVQGYSRPNMDRLLAIYEAYGIGPDFLLLGLTGNLTDQWRTLWEMRL